MLRRISVVAAAVLWWPVAMAHAQPEQCRWSSADAAAPVADAADVAAMLRTAGADAQTQLGKPARLDPQGVSAVGDWGFLQARILGADGNWIDYAGTPFADGSHSKSYVALLRRAAGGGWALVDTRVGPSDALDENWPRQFASPPVFWRCG